MDEIRALGSDGGEHELSDEFGKICISLESDEISLAHAYGPVIQSIASTLLLSAACVEAFISECAKELLEGREFDAFDRCSLDGKWLLFGRFIGSGKLKSGKEPTQGLRRLVARRNLVVHYKPRTHPSAPPRIPQAVENLGLTVESGEDAVQTVKDLVTLVSSELQH